MLIVLRTDTLLLQDSKEVFRLDKLQREGPCLRLDILINDHFSEELLRRHI